MNKLKKILPKLNEEFTRLFAISFGVFLFILFFQPFPLEMLDYNNRLIYVAGFGIITFILAWVVFVLVPILFSKSFKISEWENGPPFLLSALLLTVTGSAFAFYIRYVGKTSLSLYVLFKILLVSLLPTIILVIVYKNKSLTRVIGILKAQNKYYYSKIKTYEQEGGEKEIYIFSSNKAEKLTLKQRDLILVKSADNYIEVYYNNNDAVEKKLIRNTLKDIELQLIKSKTIVRCHRTCIVNTIYVEKLIRNYGSYTLKINCLDEKVPVSRQYLLLIKDSLESLN